MDEKTHLEENTIYCRVAYTLYATLPLPASTLQQLFLELTVNCAAHLMNHLISSKRYFKFLIQRNTRSASKANIFLR